MSKHTYGSLMGWRDTLKSIIAKRNPLSSKERTRLWYIENKHRLN